MSTQHKNLSILAQLISLIKADNDIKQREYDFVSSIAKRMGVPQNKLDALFSEAVPYKPLESEAERILQFQRLVLAMNVDEDQHPEEEKFIKEIGLKMGLSPFAINIVLKVMHEYEDKIVPPKVLIDIFKVHYN